MDTPNGLLLVDIPHDKTLWDGVGACTQSHLLCGCASLVMVTNYLSRQPSCSVQGAYSRCLANQCVRRRRVWGQYWRAPALKRETLGLSLSGALCGVTAAR